MRLIEQRTIETEIAILRERQKRLRIEKQIEQMKKEDELLEREEERLKREEELLKEEDERLEREDEQIENEIEQLRRENARLKTLLACVDQLCFPPESSSSPQKSTEPDCRPSSP
jgi:hypothetical protein